MLQARPDSGNGKHRPHRILQHAVCLLRPNTEIILVKRKLAFYRLQSLCVFKKQNCTVPCRKRFCYFAFGNHDKGFHNPAIRGFTGADLINELTKNGVRVLQDETVILNSAVYIVGRNDLSELQRGGSRLSMQKLTQGLDKSKFIIVMDHQPADYNNQVQSGADLVLSGHTHGGQLWPLNKVGEWIGANDRTYGYERRLLTDFIVTSGLSDWSIKFKTGTKSEFVIINLKSE